MEKLRSWASSLDPDIAHSARVNHIALQLYDGLSRCEVISARAEHRRILEAAAILHEVGRSKSEGGNSGTRPKRGYRMVSRLHPPLGWSEEEMHCVAVLVRYHSGGLPLTSNSSFVGLAPRRRAELMPLIGILRLANTFDREHDGSISSVSVEQQNGFLVVYGKGLRRISRAAEQLARARYLLEATSHLPILVRPMPAKTIASPQTKRLQRRAAVS